MSSGSAIPDDTGNRCPHVGDTASGNGSTTGERIRVHPCNALNRYQVARLVMLIAWRASRPKSAISTRSPVWSCCSALSTRRRGSTFALCRRQHRGPSPRVARLLHEAGIRSTDGANRAHDVAAAPFFGVPRALYPSGVQCSLPRRQIRGSRGQQPPHVVIDGGRYWDRTSDPCRVKSFRR